MSETGKMIEGVIQIFDAGDGTFQVVFTSDLGTGKFVAASKEQAVQFVSESLHAPLTPAAADRLLAGEPGQHRASITEDEYNSYF